MQIRLRFFRFYLASDSAHCRRLYNIHSRNNSKFGARSIYIRGFMKIVYFLILSALAFRTSDVTAGSLPSGFEYSTSGSDHTMLIAARADAVQLIRNAGKNPGNNLNAFAIKFGEEVIQALLSSQFAVSTTADSEIRCADNAMFVNANFQNTIFICRAVIRALAGGSTLNSLIASQIMIHEGAHLVLHAQSRGGRPHRDECRPTYFELVIMENNFGKKNIPSMGNRDAYKEQCGFSEYDDVPSKR